jgi:hypothetical protein
MEKQNLQIWITAWLIGGLVVIWWLVIGSNFYRKPASPASSEATPQHFTTQSVKNPVKWTEPKNKTPKGYVDEFQPIEPIVNTGVIIDESKVKYIPCPGATDFTAWDDMTMLRLPTRLVNISNGFTDSHVFQNNSWRVRSWRSILSYNHPRVNQLEAIMFDDDSTLRCRYSFSPWSPQGLDLSIGMETPSNTTCTPVNTGSQIWFNCS